MTRTLPWLKRPSNGTPEATPSPRSVVRRAKRRRILEPSSDIDEENRGLSRTEKTLDARASPPLILEPPSESSMDEGLNKDDKFRMVEDEFLDMAKQFTQHLHAAEYQRLKKVARSQNAAVINSISRPVTVRMPDETRRKVESVARAKRQAAAVQGLMKKRSLGLRSDEDLDSIGGAWLGTALHGLMEHPQGSTASLMKVGNFAGSARFVAGFHKRRPQESPMYSQPSSPDLESFEVTSKKRKPQTEDSMASSVDDDEDDLDAPIRSRLYAKSTKSSKPTIIRNSHATQQNLEAKSLGIVKQSRISSSRKATEHDVNDKASSRASIVARERITKRLERARLQQVKEEQEARKKLEVIPTFLS